MSEISPETRWRAHVEWMDSSFELYMQYQLSRGRSRDDALALLKSIWKREDEERLEALRRVGRATMLATKPNGR